MPVLMISKKQRSLSVKQPKSQFATCGLLLLFGSFAAIGSVAFYFSTIRPLWGVLRAQSWTETPCTIVSSEVGDHGDTYSIEIKYDYTYDGQPHRGERYHFMHGSSSGGKEGKQAVVDRYPVGMETTCYVNPGDPSETVINRGLTSDMWVGLLVLPFPVIGWGGLLGTILSRKRKSADGPALSVSSTTRTDSQADDDSADSGLEPEEYGPAELKPRYSPLGKFLGVIAMALFWNGLTSFFVYQAVKSHLDGRPEWCLTFFITPFVLVGLLLIWGIFHSFLSLFIPRPTLILDRARIPLGGETKLAWKLSGNAHIVRHLKVTLRGEEVATYRRGTDTHTDKHTFLKEIVYETHDPLEIPEGSVNIRIPDDTMHSFDSGNNKIVWEIHLDGEIPLRPDVDAEFPITVTPHEHFKRRNR